MQIELTEQEIDTTIDALRYQYDGCGDAEDGQDEENNRIADKLRDSLTEQSASQAGAKGAALDRIPFPDFALPLLKARPVLQPGNDDPMSATDPDDWWEWEFETGLPFGYTLTNCKGTDGQRWYITGHLGDREVATLKDMLESYRELAEPVLDADPSLTIPSPWRELMIEHNLLKIEPVTIERYHFL